MSAVEIALDDLAQRCAEETQKFNRRQSSDPQYCFELLRRALVDGVADAFTHFYRVYERQVHNWVYQHHYFEQAGESADYFANISLNQFYFALRGPKFNHFSSLPKALAYLKLCVHTAVAQYVRDQERLTVLSLESAGEVASTPDPAAGLRMAEIWSYICKLLPNERDRLIARCTFILSMKPSQIVAQYPGQWQNEREVSVALYRIRQLLRNDSGLRQRMDMDGGNGA
jgi:hypothetical protein